MKTEVEIETSTRIRIFRPSSGEPPTCGDIVILHVSVSSGITHCPDVLGSHRLCVLSLLSVKPRNLLQWHGRSITLVPLTLSVLGPSCVSGRVYQVLVLITSRANVSTPVSFVSFLRDSTGLGSVSPSVTVCGLSFTVLSFIGSPPVPGCSRVVLTVDTSPPTGPLDVCASLCR